jgi:hypothetical protein
MIVTYLLFYYDNNRMGRSRKKNFKEKKDSNASLGILFILALVIGILLPKVFNNSQSKNLTRQEVEKREEINKILLEKSFKKQVELYTKLIERVGPEQAQEDLQHSGVPFTGQMHLLNHTAGNIIWKKFGPSGISKCKNYFSSSCYHGFILNAIGDGNVDNINPVMSECKRTGRSSYFQCAHAVGHGFLAYVGYANLIEGLKMCDQVRSNVHDFEVNACYNGVFMENVWGLHEGRPSPDRWVKADNMNFPCDYEGLKEEHLPECWYNQIFYLNNEYYHGDYVKLSQVCINVEGNRSRSMCFDGIFRSLHSRTANDLSKKFEVCRQMPQDWQETCISIQAGAAFQQGDRELPFKICSQAVIGKSKCFQDIAGSIQFYIKDNGEIESLCNKIPIEYRVGVCRIGV